MRVNACGFGAMLFVFAAILNSACHDSVAPTTGAIAVAVSTAGTDLDDNGYTLSVDGGSGQSIPVNASVRIPNLATGEHLVQLDGVAPNCSISGTNARSVDVIAGDETGSAVSVAFFVSCTARRDVIRVTTATTGVGVPSTVYVVSLLLEGTSSFGRNLNISPNGTVTFSGLVTGDYRVTLFGVVANCDVVANPRTVALSSGNEAQIRFDVTCEAPRQIAYVNGDGAAAEIYVISSDGSGAKGLTFDNTLDADPAWSPDGKRIAFASERDGNREIYVMNADGTNPVRLTNVAAYDSGPAWSPDGERIAFVSARDGNAQIYVMDADGGNPARLTRNDANDTNPAWSPDGSRIAFQSDREGASRIWLMDTDGSHVNPLTSSFEGDREPAWSPDGGRIAFARDIVPRGREIFIVNADGSGLRQVTHVGVAYDPAWSPDGRKIAVAVPSFYYDTNIVVISADGIPFTSLTQWASYNPAWRP